MTINGNYQSTTDVTKNMESIFLKIHYGPYRAHGIVRHKIHRIHGLIELLNEQNYTLEVIPSPHLNRLTIDMMDREIFACDIRYCLYNLPADDDQMCKKALLAIKEHEKLFYTSENRPKFSDIKEGMRFMIRSEPISVASDFGYNLQMPQNSLKSSFVARGSSRGELSDICTKYGYGMYNLGSADLILDTQDSEHDKVSIATTTTSKSGLLDDYWICDDNTCYPTCPPGSLVLGELSSLELTEEDQVLEEEKVVRIMEIDDVSPVNKEGLYKCKECGECYCICD